MKVRAVCPACGRPASSPGRSECLYCGAPLSAVVTGTVSAAGSGRPVAVAPENLKGPAALAPRPSPPRDKPAWMRYEAEERPVARFFENGWVRLALVVSLVLAGILTIAKVIDDHRPPGYVQKPLNR